MTTLTEARDAIVEHLNTAWQDNYAAVKVYYDNADDQDWDSQAEWLSCEIEFMDSEQAEFGVNPFIRHHGMVSLTLGVKSATGSRISLQRADFLMDTFRFVKKQGVNFKAPHLLPPTRTKGWFLTELMVPFFFDG